MDKNCLQKVQEVVDKVADVTEKQLDKAKNFFDSKTEIVKLEWEIASTKNALDKLLVQYGKAAYYGADSELDLEVVGEEIEKTEEKLKELLDELEALKPEEKQTNKSVFCTKCGTEYDADDDSYCSKCGSKLKK